MVGRRHLALTAVLCALVAILMGPASARAAGNAQIRLAELSSDSANVDVYMDGTKMLSNVGYKTISNYTEVSAGAHSYHVKAAGAAADAPDLVQVAQSLEADRYYSVVVAGKSGDLRANIFTDAAGPNPPADFCQARYLHASTEVPKVDVFVRGPDAILRSISFMEASEYIRMPSGVYDIELRSAGTTTVIFTVKNFNADGGHIHTLAAAGGVGRPVELVEMYDSVSATVTPQGGAATGSGGMAVLRNASALGLLAFGLFGSSLVVVAVIGRRRRTA